MKFSQFILIPIMVASLAFTLQIVDQSASGLMPLADNKGFGWVAFISWPMYFLAGCNMAGGRKVFYGYVVGIIASILIMEIGPMLMGVSSFLAFPIAIFLIVVPCICLERFPPFDLIPAIFVGAGIFFGIMTYVPGATYTSAAITELTYCVLGIAYGWLTIFLRAKYEASLNIESN